MATINDVCKLAGVSKTTVSRVINGKGQVKESTRQVVFDAMEQLHFKPNSLARALAKNSSNSIGLILSTFNGNYFGELLSQAAKLADQAGKQLFVTDGHNDPKREIEAIDSLVDRRCDVIVLYSRYLSEQDLIDIKQRIPIPIVIINQQLQGSTCHAVCFDQEHAARLAVNQLLDMNHKQIVCLTSPLNASSGVLRLKGYQDALAQRNIPVNKALIVQGQNTIVSGYDACKKLLRSGVSFTAIFACNDDMAIGVMKALTEAGLKIPEDLSIIGIDNETIGSFITPTLSTVEMPITEMTSTAIKMALDLAGGKEIEGGTKEFRGKLIVRDSTAFI
ncbi:MAG: DNA-binding LacI/PurR family transcriptional regulator [Psychromonas sp.]|jgi:DNA-binding LacI/PurR family transcriptional regulator|uniref:LacI family DNA-binding transcriptional regulator n=1 Tax=Psychromonas sp. TaxID=1884585 RepID=UPI0039E32D9D